MYRRRLFRFWLILGVSLLGRLNVEAATVQLNTQPDVLVGNGIGANGGGLLDGTVGFTTNIVTTNANSSDRAYFQTVDNHVRTWIDDATSNQVNWNSSFTMDFSIPISGLKIIPATPGNSADTVIWSVQWDGSSNEAVFVNSPDTLNEHSLYDDGVRLTDGTYVSGTEFRMDDDGAAGSNTNGSVPNDLNLQRPTTPWSIALPDDVTSVTIQATIADGAVINRAREGFGIDFTDVVIVPVPEPSNLAFLLLVSLAFFFKRR